MLGLILAITLEILPRNCYGCIRYLCFYYFYSYRSILQQFRLLTDQGDKLELTSLHFILHSRYLCFYYFYSYRLILQQFRLLTDQGDKLELTSLHFLLHSLLRYTWPIFRISYHFYLLRKSMFYWWGLSLDIFCNPQLITLRYSLWVNSY